MKIYMANQGALQEVSEQKNPVFTSGDAYLINDEAKKNIWIWLGKSASVDEKGTVAREAKQIDQGEYEGAAKITTVDQDQEPAEFMGLFESLRVLNKNLAKTMLKDVKTGSWSGHMDHVDVLYKVSSEEYDGIDRIKYVQVDFKKESLDDDDVLIADLGEHIWIWQGKNSNVKEKVTAMKFAQKFDVDRAGAQKIEVFIDGDDCEPFLDLFDGKFPKGKVNLDYDPELGVMRERPMEDEPKAEPKPAPKAEPKAAAEPAPAYAPQKRATPPQQGGSSGSLMVQTETGRLKCPSCGNVNRNMMREVENRDNIIMDYPLMYGKKYICGNCGTHWRKQDDFE